MLRQAAKLTAVQLTNLFGFNEVRHTADRKKKTRYGWMAVLWFFLILLLVSYVCGLVFGLDMLGLGDLVPAYLFTVASAVIFFFGIFKAGGTLFARSSFEAMSALPVKKSAIVVSRFLTMYVYDFLLALSVMAPGLAFYAILHPQPALYYVAAVLGVILLPLLPLAAASIVGAVITAISSRFRHRSLFSALLTVLFVVGILAGEMLLAGNGEAITEEVMSDLAVTLGDQIRNLYPPAFLFSDALLEGDLLKLAVLAAISVAVVVVLVALVTPKFGSLCSSLTGNSAKGGYRLGSMHAGSQLSALYRSEFKRYFASSTWVSNTAVGYVLMIVMCAALLFVDISTLTDMLGSPELIARMLPMIIGIMFCMSAATPSAISMEGKQWWLVKSLPVDPGTLVNSKLLVTLTLSLPSWLICSVLLNIALDVSLTDRIWITLIPLLYALFAAVCGLRINAAIPIFDWDSDIRVVKQSASMGVFLLIGMLTGIVPIAIILTVSHSDTVMLAVSAVLAVATVILHRSCTKLRPEKLG